MSITMVSMFFMMYPRAAASATRIAEVIDTESMITDGGFSGDTERRGYVEFKNVSFSYPGADEEVLHDISFKAEPGKTTAIIGSTGSGKSTIANLLPRFYDATEGEIYIDGKNVREYDLKTLRDKIGYVPQKAVLFSGTIADNLRFGNQNATEDDMKRAAETAQAMEFISSKDKGFNSYIAQGGANVSGGQKQRLSIARAIVKRPEIYVFDDSFSALDYKTDAALRKALKGETKDAAVIIIAQRISTIMHADSIVVLDEGKIAGIGTHQELLDSCSVYREIVDSQFKKGELDS
jgi:ATP-binding cassette subfamily B protein